MYPTLFQIGSVRIDSYSVIWFIALSLAIIWMIKRLEIYGLDEYESRRVMAVSFFFMLLGARSFEYILNWKDYMNDPSLFLDINRGGMHEVGAISGAFISAMLMCFLTRRVSFSKLCDAAGPPMILSIAVGRWGCFLNGCCVGLPTKFFTGVHFPFDKAGVFRHPVQIYYSVIAAVIVLILLRVEKRILNLQRGQPRHYSVIAPLSVILYSLMRIAIIPLRDEEPFLQIMTQTLAYRIIIIAILSMSVWLSHSLRKLKSAKIS